MIKQLQLNLTAIDPNFEVVVPKLTIFKTDVVDNVIGTQIEGDDLLVRYKGKPFAIIETIFKVVEFGSAPITEVKLTKTNFDWLEINAITKFGQALTVIGIFCQQANLPENRVKVRDEARELAK